ncbi:hypothetical protein STSP2_01641 [Anaerohalosphaera lusitana]|uniref:Uncharacterized protein n=1 Tax=Anaerohalosphaera lusitana TaxID=1936003 RepID=A0A1U9NKZ9_9BACT|nr:hypothetical protein STSP2_01641 [Anaerohalosphaera lusitana]
MPVKRLKSSPKRLCFTYEMRFFIMHTLTVRAVNVDRMVYSANLRDLKASINGG